MPELSRSQRVLTNIGSLLLGRIVVGSVTLATLALLGRSLRTEQFGLLMLAIAASELYAILADFGMSYLMVREVAKGKELRHLFTTALLAKSVIGFPALLLAANIIVLAYPSAVAQTLLLGLGYGMANTMFLFFLSFFNGLQRMGTSALFLSAQSLCVSAFSIGGLLIGADSAFVIMALRIVAIIGVMLASYVVLRKAAGATISWVAWKDVTSLLSTAVPFGLFFIGSAAYFQTDSFQLSAYLGETAVGEYQAAMKLVILLEVFPLNAANAMYPALALMYASSQARTTDIVERITKYLVLGSLPVSALLWMFAGPIVGFLFGPEYSGTVAVLQILALLVPLRFAGHLLGVSITVGNAQHRRMIASLSAAAVNIGLNAIFIPIGGTQAAALVSLVTSATIIGLYLWAIQGVLPGFSFHRTFKGPIVISLTLLVTAWLVSSLSLAMQVLSLTAVGCAVAWLSGTVSHADVEFVRSLLSRRSITSPVEGIR